MKDVLQLCAILLVDPNVTYEQKKDVRKFAVKMIEFMLAQQSSTGCDTYSILR